MFLRLIRNLFVSESDLNSTPKENEFSSEDTKTNGVASGYDASGDGKLDESPSDETGLSTLFLE